MARISVTITNFKGNQFKKQQIATIVKLSQLQLKTLADQTAIVIRQKISERIERQGSTGNLERGMFVVPIDGGFGVGDINHLNKNVPYWYWQNFGVAQSGRKVPPKSFGKFTPGDPRPNSNGGDARFEQGSNGFQINPQKAITPKHYIEATISEINKIVSDVTRRITL